MYIITFSMYKCVCIHIDYVMLNFHDCSYCIVELMADLLKQKPEEDTSLDNIIVVDNAPIVGPDRMVKLKNVLKKIFQRFGEIVTEFYPTNDNGETKG